jgi:hypothetical protein
MNVQPLQALNKQQLLAAYPNMEWRAKLVELVDLTNFLQSCIIRNEYKVPDAVVQCVPLSQEGDRVFRELTKQQVPAKEARLLCLLEMLYVDLLVDIEAADVDKLAKFIGDQVISRDILLAPTLGPALYQRAADLFPDEHRFLSAEETIRLLDGAPIGVFQNGNWVSGPFGLSKSDSRRSNYATRLVPLQHCHDLTCKSIHSAMLDTASGAPINQNRHKVQLVLDKRSETPSEWGPFLTEVIRNDDARYDDQDLSTLPYLIGDTLSDHELRELFRWLMNETKDYFRSIVGSLSLTGDATAVAADLDREQLLQAIYLCDDARLFTAIDDLTLRGVFVLPEGEVRISPLRPNRRSGAFGALAELSQHGIRVDTALEIGPLRLRHLVDLMYPADDPSSQQELGWQLRSVEGETTGSRLEEYLRTEVPAVAIRQLVLARPSNLETACRHLKLDRALLTSDERAVACILWKLGFAVAAGEDLRDRFWAAHERAIQAGRAASVSAIIDQEALRGTVATYFIELERLLEDTLAFATWVLMTDHLRQPHPFAYDDVEGRNNAFERLTEFAAKREIENGRDSLVFGEKNTLYPLCRGFGLLAQMLYKVREDSEGHERAKSEWPDFTGHTSLQRFPFIHTVVFLDLTRTSQNEIISLLTDVSKRLIAGNVSDVRNEQLHFRRSTADLERLLKCVSAVEQAVRTLDNAGLTRVLYTEKRRESDAWGRSTVFMADRHGREIAFGRPNSYRWLHLPSLDRPQYLIACAQFADPNEPLRVSQGMTSEFTQLWSNYPRRPRASARLVEGDRLGPTGVAANVPSLGDTF